MAKKKNNKNSGTAFNKKDFVETIKNTGTKVLDISHYTFDSWKRSQHGNLENYESLQSPDDYMAFTFMAAEQSGLLTEKDGLLDIVPGISPKLRLRIVVIDENYYKWLGDREDNSQARLQYIQQVSDSTALRLLQKNKLNRTLTMNVIPVTVIRKNMNEKSSNITAGENRKKILKILETVYGKGNVWFPGYVCRAEDICNERDTFYSLAKTYFDEKVNARLDKFAHQYWLDEANLFFMGMPFVVKHEYNHATISLEEILGDKDVFDIHKLRSDCINFMDAVEDGEADIDEDEYDYTYCDFSFTETGLEDLILESFPEGYAPAVLPIWEDTIEYAMNVSEMQNMLLESGASAV